MDPGDPAVACAGADVGSVWRTTNCCSADITLTMKTEFPEVARIAIGDLTFNHQRSEHVDAGAGGLRLRSRGA